MRNKDETSQNNPQNESSVSKPRFPYRRGLDVVGYTGFVPAKVTGNVFGKTFSRANLAAQGIGAVCQSRFTPAHGSFIEKALRVFEENSPSSATGNYNMYSTRTTRTSSSRSNSCML